MDIVHKLNDSVCYVQLLEGFRFCIVEASFHVMFKASRLNGIIRNEMKAHLKMNKSGNT
jgi:hypothetical protein